MGLWRYNVGVNLSVYVCLRRHRVQAVPRPLSCKVYEPAVTPSREKCWMDGKQHSEQYLKVCYWHLKVPNKQFNTAEMQNYFQ